MPDYDDFRDSLTSVDGMGGRRFFAIIEEYPDAEQFIEACKKAYYRGDVEGLTRIDGIGENLASHRLPMWAADEFGWST